MVQGIYSRRQLEALGVTHKIQIRRLIEDGRLRRLTKGWYADATADPVVCRALENNLRPGCLTACRMHGLWTPASKVPHYLYPRTAHRPRLEQVVLHRVLHQLETVLPTVVESIEQVIRHHDVEASLIVLESAVNLRMLTYAEAKTILQNGGKRKDAVLRHLRPGAQSGSETRVRLFLQQARSKVASQVFIPAIGRVDLLVGKSLIIECDSRAHHSNPKDYHHDRQRDAAAFALGYTVIRLSYEQIWYDWENTKSFLKRMLATGRHLSEPRTI